MSATGLLEKTKHGRYRVENFCVLSTLISRYIIGKSSMPKEQQARTWRHTYVATNTICEIHTHGSSQSLFKEHTIASEEESKRSEIYLPVNR